MFVMDWYISVLWYCIVIYVSPHIYGHQHLLCLPNIQSCRLSWLRNWRWRTLVDLFMRWGSILAVGLSLRLDSCSLFSLTAFVVFINITFCHPDRYAFPGDSSEIKFSTPPKYLQYFYPNFDRKTVIASAETVADLRFSAVKGCIFERLNWSVCGEKFATDFSFFKSLLFLWMFVLSA